MAVPKRRRRTRPPPGRVKSGMPRTGFVRTGFVRTGLAEEERPFGHDEIVGGVAASRVKSLIDRGVLDGKQVYRVIPERTFHRRVANREALKAPEADAIGRLLRITQMAERLLGDRAFAHDWLKLPNPALQNRIPIELAETDAGAREAEAILMRIAYGDFS